MALAFGRGTRMKRRVTRGGKMRKRTKKHLTNAARLAAALAAAKAIGVYESRYNKGFNPYK